MFTFPKTDGRSKASQNERWWEREWRHVDDFHFKASDIAFWLCPEGEISGWEAVVAEYHAKDKASAGTQIPRCIDPRWGLEQIIAHLGGLPLDSISPFSTERDDSDNTPEAPEKVSPT